MSSVGAGGKFTWGHPGSEVNIPPGKWLSKAWAGRLQGRRLTCGVVERGDPMYDSGNEVEEE